MDHYSMTLGAIKKLLDDIGMNKYSAVVNECIQKWQDEGDSTLFGREFDNNGRFADFRLDNSVISNIEKGMWIGQVLSALIAMAAQLSAFAQRGMQMDLDFIRRNFGAANEIMEITKCQDCGRLEATAMDIDKYVSKIVIAKKIVDGMERGNLNDQIDEIENLTAPEIERERRKAKLRLENSRISYTDTYGKVKSCAGCGSKNITDRKLLRSVKENVFIELSR